MKAFRPDGSRWFRPTASEVMAGWLEDPELQRWLECTRELSKLSPFERLIFEALTIPVGMHAEEVALSRKLHMQHKLDVMRAKLQRIKAAVARDPFAFVPRESKHAGGHQPKQRYRGRR